MRRMMLLICAVLLGAFSAAAALAADTYSIKEGWQYRWGDPALQDEPVSAWLPSDGEAEGSWQEHSTYPKPVPGRKNETNLWMRVRLPQSDIANPSLIVDGVDQNMEVYLDNEKIYTFGNFNSKGQGTFQGYPWHDITLPEDHAGRMLSFRIWADHVNIGLVGDVRLSGQGVFFKQIFRENISDMIALTIIVFVGLIGLILYAVNPIRVEFLAFGLLGLFEGIYNFTRSPFRQFLLNEPLLWTYIELASLYIAATAFFAFLDSILVRTWHNVLRRCWQILTVYTLASAIAVATDLVPLYKTLLPFQLMFMISIILGISFAVRKAASGDRDAKIIVTGMVALLSGAALDLFIAMGLIFPELKGGLVSTIWGFVAMLMAFVAILALRFLDVFHRVVMHKRNLEMLAEEERKVESTHQLPALVSQVQKSLSRLADAAVESKVFYSNSVFVDKNLAQGYYEFDSEGNLDETTPVMRENVAAQGTELFLVQDALTAESLALVPVSPVSPRQMSAEETLTWKHETMDRNRPLLEPITNNMASAITTVRLEKTFDMLDRRTQEIRTVFANINQGILMLDESLKILPDYSAFLETFLGVKDLAGQDFVSLVLGFSNLSGDEKSDIHARMEAAIGESSVAWELNTEDLLRECVLTLNGIEKVIEIDWTAIIDDNDIVQRCMITIRDVTALRKLHEQAAEHQEEMNMIGEIVSKPAEDFNAFINSARKYVKESVELLGSPTPPDAPALNHVKRNLHTVKGNSRVVGLKGVANLTHEVESRLVAGMESEHVPCAEILELIQTIGSLVERYETVSRERLGRSGQTSKSVTSALQDSLNLARKHMKDSGIAESLRTELRELYTRLVNVSSPTVSGVFGRVGASLTELASQLGRPKPELILEGREDWVLGSDLAEVMGSALTHIMRNSVDHGFRGLSEGAIKLHLESRGEIHLLTYRDTGLGLNIKKLREKGINAGILAANSDDADVARLIFAPSLSTAEKVTDVSGRGVGMDAVKVLLEGLGICVETELTGACNEAGYCPFILRFRVPAVHVHEVIDITGLAVLPDADVRTYQDDSKTTPEKISA